MIFLLIWFLTLIRLHYCICISRQIHVLLKRIDHSPHKRCCDKHQITTAFTVSAAVAFLPTQLIYEGATERCLPKCKFPKKFNVTYKKYHWLNLEICVDLFEIIILPYLRAKKIELGCRQEQFSLIIMDTVKDQDNEEIKSLCLEDNCELVIVPHNLTNKF